MELVTLNNNEKDILIETDKMVEFVLNEGETVTLQNRHPYVNVLYQFSNDLERGWFQMKPNDMVKIEKNIFFRLESNCNTAVKLVTSRS